VSAVATGSAGCYTNTNSPRSRSPLGDRRSARGRRITLAKFGTAWYSRARVKLVDAHAHRRTRRQKIDSSQPATQAAPTDQARPTSLERSSRHGHGAHVRGELPAVAVEHEREVEEAVPGPEVGDVADHFSFAWVAAKSRCNRSRASSAASSGIVVRLRRARSLPSSPCARMTRATRSRPTSMPRRRSSRQALRAPYAPRRRDPDGPVRPGVGSAATVARQPTFGPALAWGHTEMSSRRKERKGGRNMNVLPASRGLRA
jgi:hypothetical protein